MEANRASEAVIDLMWRGRRDPRSIDQPSLGGTKTRTGGKPPACLPWATRVFLASIDHHPRWRIPQCYFPTGEVRYRDDFTVLAEAMAKYATSATGGTPITADVRKPLGAILHELFKNTHEWARTDVHGAPLLRSVRGLLAQGHTWAEEEAKEVAEGSEALAKYLAHPAVPSKIGRWRFLELSIFDSGIGLARRWLASKRGGEIKLTDVQLDEEYAAVHGMFLAVELFNARKPQRAWTPRGHADIVRAGRVFPGTHRPALHVP